mmetsp:Transcript_31248/g.40199  ORF Transcript_31248/g.40199 Transcript_31248/m.40199 type:complete len:156 (+) Transcript_31248:1-468(+)
MTSGGGGGGGEAGSSSRMVPSSPSMHSLRNDPRYIAMQQSSQQSAASRQSSHEPASLTLPPSQKYRSMRRHLGPEDMDTSQQLLNEKALAVIKRVQDKLTGRDFPSYASSHSSSHSSTVDIHGACDVKAQVNLLIEEASSNERLCVMFIGWCPFW